MTLVYTILYTTLIAFKLAGLPYQTYHSIYRFINTNSANVDNRVSS